MTSNGAQAHPGQGVHSMSRTIKVLGALVAGVTVVSGVLLALEPSPTLRPSNMAFSAFDSNTSLNGPEAMLFDTAPSQAWKDIIVYDSRGIEGGQVELDRYFRNTAKVPSGAGFHFVIRRDGAGRIEVCERWRQQAIGAFVFDKDPQVAKMWNSQSIGICLMGDDSKKPFDQAQLQEVQWLIKQLKERYKITDDRVRVLTSKSRLTARAK